MPLAAMQLVGYGTVAPAPAAASPVARRLGLVPWAARMHVVPAATKSVVAAKAAAKEEKGLFDLIFGPLYKEEQLLETDPILNKVEGKAPAARKAGTMGGKKAAAGDDGGNGGFGLGGLFSKKG
ncbi:hypothetical protein ACP70R_048088 [Stipagrostis hirtigluma subsp. patula]